ncbi:MAG: acyltransferase [Oscillospiraceae bacterium]|nr:acyltransferase [Oscillospiraceae bacterium]
MNAPKEKIQFIAGARCIGILLVVLGHSYPFNVSIPAFWEQVRSFLYLFHMPLFIFISGYLVTKNTRPAGTYIARRATRLLIPYFALSLIAFVPKVMVQQFLNDSAEFSVAYLIKSELIPRQNVWGHFWYLPAIFLLGCLGVILTKPFQKNKWIQPAALIVSLAMLYLPTATDWLGLEDIRKNAFYFILGMVFADTKAEWILRSPFWLLALPAAVFLFQLPVGIFSGCAIACLMIGFILCICTLADITVLPVLKNIELNSFSIFLLSWPAQAVTEVLLNKLLHLPVAVTMVCMFTAGLVVPLICRKLVLAVDRRIPLGWLKIALGM